MDRKDMGRRMPSTPRFPVKSSREDSKLCEVSTGEHESSFFGDAQTVPSRLGQFEDPITRELGRNQFPR